MTRFTKAALGAGVPLILGSWLLFRPEKLFLDQVVSDKPLPPTARLLAQGSFTSGAHETNGAAELYEVDGKTVLRLVNFRTSNGPDVHVLVTEGKKHPQTTDLGKLKGNIGDQNYQLPKVLNLEHVSVSIWCSRFSVNFADATLRPS